MVSDAALALQIAPIPLGRIEIQYRRVECVVPSGVTINVVSPTLAFTVNNDLLLLRADGNTQQGKKSN